MVTRIQSSAYRPEAQSLEEVDQQGLQDVVASNLGLCLASSSFWVSPNCKMDKILEGGNVVTGVLTNSFSMWNTKMSCLDFYTYLIGHVLKIDSLKGLNQDTNTYIRREGPYKGYPKRLPEDNRTCHPRHFTCHTTRTKKQSSTKVLIKHSLLQTHTLPPAPPS